MTSDTQTFTAAELQRMLDWYRALGRCHDVVPRDNELADKVALEIARVRTHSAGLPSR